MPWCPAWLTLTLPLALALPPPPPLALTLATGFSKGLALLSALTARYTACRQASRGWGTPARAGGQGQGEGEGEGEGWG